MFYISSNNVMFMTSFEVSKMTGVYQPKNIKQNILLKSNFKCWIINIFWSQRDTILQ